MWPFVVVVSLVIFIWLYWRKPINYPPGFGIPVLGYIPYSGENIKQTIFRSKDVFGDFIHWRIGTKDVIFLTNSNDVKELFGKDIFLKNITSTHYSFTKEKDITKKRTNWKKWKSFYCPLLADFTTKAFAIVNFEANDFLSCVIKQDSKIMDTLEINVLNVIWRFIADERYESIDPYMLEIHELLEQKGDSKIPFSIKNMMQWYHWSLMKPLKQVLPAETSAEGRSELTRFVKRLVDDHKINFDKSNPKDLIDNWLLHILSKKQLNSRDETDFISSIVDAFIEATTITKLLKRFFSLISVQSDVQNLLQEEVDKKQSSGFFTEEVFDKLEYTKAAIMETLRVTPSLTCPKPRLAMEDYYHREMIIPKGSIVLALTEACQFNSTKWNDPFVFNPGRFVNEYGKTDYRGFMPFGSEGEGCIGKNLAMRITVGFVSKIIKMFHILPSRGTKMTPLVTPFDNEINTYYFEQRLPVSPLTK